MKKILDDFKIPMDSPMSTIVATEAPSASRSSSGFRLAMLLPGALVTFFLILFALGLVLFLAFRGNDGSLLGAGFTLANFITVRPIRSTGR